MGQPNVKNAPPPLTKIQLDIVCAKVEAFIVLERDRKIEALFRKEGVLLDCSKKPGVQISQLRNQASANINLLKWVQGANMILQNVKIVTAHTMALERGQHKPQEIKELIPAISAIIWATSHLNLAAIQEFNFIVNRNFSQVLYQQASAGENVDLKLKKNFATLMPTVFEIDDYLKDFFRRHSEDIDEPVRQGYLDSMKATPHHPSGGMVEPNAADPKVGQTTIISDFQTNPIDGSQAKSMLGSQLQGENAQKLAASGNLNASNLDFLAQLEDLQPGWAAPADQTGPVNPNESQPMNSKGPGGSRPPVNMSHQGSGYGGPMSMPDSYISNNVVPADPFAASHGLQNNTMGSGGIRPDSNIFPSGGKDVVAGFSDSPNFSG
jgi:hypothetical protein